MTNAVCFADRTLKLILLTNRQKKLYSYLKLYNYLWDNRFLWTNNLVSVYWGKSGSSLVFWDQL